MLLIGTSRGYGRGLARAIGRYVTEHGPWSIHFQERALHDRLPSSVRNWRGDDMTVRHYSNKGWKGRYLRFVAQKGSSDDPYTAVVELGIVTD